MDDNFGFLKINLAGSGVITGYASFEAVDALIKAFTSATSANYKPFYELEICEDLEPSPPYRVFRKVVLRVLSVESIEAK